MAIRLKRGLNAQFANQTLVAGEPAFVTDTGKLYIGNGTSKVLINPDPVDISGKANIASPTFTGTPAAPTPAAGTNTTQIATTAFVTTAVNNKTSITGNAGSATKLATARTIGGVSFDGTANISLTPSSVGLGNVANESKATMFTSPALTGTPTAPTAAAGTNSTQLATTAFVTTAINNKTSITGNAGSATKLATARTIAGVSFDGTANISITPANIGLGNVTNESKATMFANPTFTGIPKAPTAALGNNTTQIATTQFVGNAINDIEIGGVNLLKNTDYIDGVTYWNSPEELGEDGEGIVGIDSNSSIRSMKIYRELYNGTDRFEVEQNISEALEANKTYTLSGYIYVDNSIPFDSATNIKNEINIRYYNASNTDVNVGSYDFGAIEKNKWIKFSTTFKIGSDINISNSNHKLLINLGKNGSIKLSRLKLEEGNKPTSWSLSRNELRLKDIVQQSVTTQNGTAFGVFTVATGSYSYAEGYGSRATGPSAHAEGNNTTATGNYSHAEGYGSDATSYGSHAEGYNTEASGSYSHAEGRETIANNFASHASGYFSKMTLASAGSYSSTADAFVIGNGTSNTARGNAFRVSFNGKAYGLSAYNSTGADYAEYFEWKDGNLDNEDRVGFVVTLDGDKIRKATKDDDYILGIVSANPSVIGDSYQDDWQGKYLLDDWGRIQYRNVDVEHIEKDENNNEIVTIKTELHPIYNPDWDSNVEYIPREKRKEWSAVGLVGKLLAKDDNSCIVNKYAKIGVDGELTLSDTITNIRVIERVRDSTVRVFIK